MRKRKATNDRDASKLVKVAPEDVLARHPELDLYRVRTKEGQLIVEGVKVSTGQMLEHLGGANITVTLNGQALPGEPFFCDSIIIPKALQQCERSPEALFEQLRAQGAWEPRESPYLLYRGHEIARRKFFLSACEHGKNSVGQLRDVRKYAYTGAQWELLLHYHELANFPLVAEMTEWLHRSLKVTVNGSLLDNGFNHVIGTLYEDGEDGISAHNDKHKDIAQGSVIVMMSFGGRRELHFAPGTEKDRAKYWKPVGTQPFVMEPGTMVILGPKTNALFKHWIATEKEEVLIDRSVEPVTERISLVFRNIKTVVKLRQIKNQTMRKMRKNIKEGKSNARPIPPEYHHLPDDPSPQ